ncbi:MAG: hypothetical protein IJH40_08545 [Ruminococcus sp.]|uniref:hypothetical protein n=1 Tax=Ruminococcus sp. TaxID=41978 RepID=UPI0028732057|nr:hypothetical protein [Ruminococcus sp.]MBQ3285674.1 hypothetical protein [Ruminococcus sp.]
MKRLLSILLLAVILAGTLCTTVVFSNAAEAPTKVINVVYDDSGSMFMDYDKDQEPIDSWSQAKYAMEVFAALLNENTTMNIYVMSDYDDEYGNPDNPPMLQLDSADGAEENVKKVHDMITKAYGTPFDSVRKAYKDLENCTADEKWLVILTDGSFDGIDNIDNFFKGKKSDINVLFLGLGPEVKGIAEDDSKHIYFDKADENNPILERIIQAATRVLNKDRLDVNPSTKRFSFDVPMKELVVFAQGSDVTINNIKDSHGNIYESTSDPVNVQYSEKGFSNLDEHFSDPSDFTFKFDKNLKGSLATFDDEFPEGEYTVDVSGAETIEIYYQPHVEIATYLTNSDGEEVTDLEDLEIGTYTIDFALVNANTGEKIADSELLGDVSYVATITNGSDNGSTFAPGDEITIEEGELTIDAVATYLDYHTVTTNKTYTVFKNKEITFESAGDTEFTVTSNGFSESTPMKVKMLADGKDVTAEQWSKIENVPEVELSNNAGFKLGEFTVTKSDEPGIFEITPSMPENGFDGIEYKDCDITLSFKDHCGSELWSGKSDVKMDLTDDRDFFTKHRDKIITLILSLIALLLILGYMPFIKNYFPAKMKKKPSIQCEPESFGEDSRVRKGLFEKSLLSTLIPYVPEKGKVKYVPAGVVGAPLLRLKAARGRRMHLTNSKDFVGKDHITFNSIPITEPRTKELTVSTQIVVKTQEWTYTCVLNR